VCKNPAILITPLGIDDKIHLAMFHHLLQKSRRFESKTLKGLAGMFGFRSVDACKPNTPTVGKFNSVTVNYSLDIHPLALPNLLYRIGGNLTHFCSVRRAIRSLNLTPVKEQEKRDNESNFRAKTSLHFGSACFLDFTFNWR
jgi:hypothetical protein